LHSGYRLRQDAFKSARTAKRKRHLACFAHSASLPGQAILAALPLKSAHKL
jgi:hypothetical protein